MKFQVTLITVAALLLPVLAHAGTYREAQDACFNRPTSSVSTPPDPGDPANTFCLVMAMSRRDYGNALMLRAAEAGYAPAQYAIGRDYEDGMGFAADVDQALAWYLKAAEQGLADAQNEYGFIYFYGKHGVEQDAARAVPWFRKASDQGYTHSMTLLAEAYYQGKGVDKDLAEAFRLYKAAADLGHPYARFMVGRMYLKGEAVAQDRPAGLALVEAAAEAGIADAQEQLAYAYLPEGGGADPVTARMWYEIYIAGGNEPTSAMEALQDSLSEEQISQARQRASAWLEKHNKR